MKTIKFNLFLTVVFTGLTLITGCSKDDDDENNNPNPNPGVEQITQGWSEDGNTAHFKYNVKSGPYTMGWEYTFTFTNNKCTKTSWTVECGSAAIAQATYESMDADEKRICRVSGSKIICDADESYTDMTKDELKAMMEAMQQSGVA